MKPFVVDDDPRCSSSEAHDASGNTFHTKFLCRNTVLTLLPSTICLADSDMIAWDRQRYQALLPASPKTQVQRGPKNPNGGPMMLIIWGPILTTAPRFYDTGSLIAYKNGDPGSPFWEILIFIRHQEGSRKLFSLLWR